jgi:hypothetical protein
VKDANINGFLARSQRKNQLFAPSAKALIGIGKRDEKQ